MGRELFVPAMDGRIVPNHDVERWIRAAPAGGEVQRTNDNSRSFTIERIEITASPTEPVADTLPRRLRHMAFLEGLNA